MAWDFPNTIGDYFSRRNSPLSNGPATLACWFKVDATSGEDTFLAVVESGASSPDRFQIMQEFGVMVAGQGDSTGFDAIGKSGVSASTWHHGAGQFNSSTSRYAFLDGVKGMEGTSSKAFPTAMDETYIGVVNKDGTFSAPMNGALAEVGVWNVALTDAEIASLATGMTPLMVRPDALVGYWPLHSREGRG